jgi:hypothetical protein
MPAMSSHRNSQGSFRRVWAKAFWGFEPESEGFLGFTRPGDRERLLASFRAGDLIMIYGTKGASTNRSDRGNSLGFLEIAAERIDARQRMSQSTVEWRQNHGLFEKWNYAVPVLRAWRVSPGQMRKIETIASTTYDLSNAQNIATRGMLLSPSESLSALSLQVAETPVFVSEDEVSSVSALFLDAFVPSRGLEIAPGPRSFEFIDGPTKVYLLRWSGPATQMLDTRYGQIEDMSILKIGLSKNPVGRCEGLNRSLPPAGTLKWTVIAESKFFPDGQSAKSVEDKLKTHFSGAFRSLGGEFFLGNVDAASNRFLAIARRR